MKLTLVSRASTLARRQTQIVISALEALHPGLQCEERLIITQGDKMPDQPLPEIGGKGLFTSELEADLLSGRADCAVHSLKDLPVESPPELTVGCIPARADVRDVLVAARGHRLASLPAHACVGTSSLRRAAQILCARPDLRVVSLRGNLDTRLRKAREGLYDAIVLAGAGLTRLGLDGQVTEWLPLDIMLPAPGQGALAVQCRVDSRITLELLAALDDLPTRKAVTAERAFLSGLGGGCSVPVAAHAETSPVRMDEIHLTGLVISLDGKNLIRVTGQGREPLELGHGLAQQALARGANQILGAGSGNGSLPR